MSNKMFNDLDSGKYYIRTLTGKFFTGKKFSKIKSEAKSFSFDNVCIILKKLRKKDFKVTFEVV